MANPRQLWVLAGGNGAGKTTFYNLYLAKYGIRFVNADLIAKDIDPENPEGSSYHAAIVAARIREDLISQREWGTLLHYEVMIRRLRRLHGLMAAPVKYASPLLNTLRCY